MDDGSLDEVVAEFLIEGHERIDQLDQDLLALEAMPTPEVIGSIFRSLHSIKGTCGFLGFERLERVTHVAEGLIVALRDEEVEVTEDVAAALLQTVDAARQMLLLIESTGTDGEDDYRSLIDLLNRLRDPEQEAPRPRLGEILVARTSVTNDDIERAVADQKAGDARPMGEILIGFGVVTAEEIEAALSAQASHTSGGRERATIRVDVEVLDGLVDLVADLGLVRDLLTNGRGDPFAADPAALRRLDRITAELADAVMVARMQPVGTAWRRAQRVVRDVAKACGKQVELEAMGSGVLVDRTVLEGIKDPLTHMIRNAVDHGIETPDERVRVGKPPVGRVVVSARRDESGVVIEVSDDGRGIDVDLIMSVAVKRGLVSKQVAATMSMADRLALVFTPGLSTAGAVTKMSGRGVGMDVVKTNIEAIGGTLTIASQRGSGTTLELSLPSGPPLPSASLKSADPLAVCQLNRLRPR